MITTAVILAGGQARRMGGGDKCLLKLGNTTLLSHVITKLKPQICDIALNTNSDPALFRSYDLPIISDSIPGFAGPLAGVLAGMDWAASHGADRLLSVAADTPFFPDQLRTGLELAIESQQTPLAMATTPDPQRGIVRHPTFGLWDVSLRDDLRAALNDGLRKVILWTKPHGCAEIMFDGYAYEPFFNVNTPQDLEKAQEILARITS